MPQKEIHVKSSEIGIDGGDVLVLTRTVECDFGIASRRSRSMCPGCARDFDRGRWLVRPIHGPH